MIRSRYMDEWVGLVVVASVAVFLGVALQAGFLRDWFKPVSTLRILLPEAGVAGLSVGADVEVLGTRAGRITRIVIDPSEQMHAEAEIDEQATAFIRRDSRAVIRKRFGVAGAAYVDIQRGDGPELDWNYAVIQAETERAPTETVGALIDELRAKVFPVLDDAGRAMKSLAVTMERVEQGEGNIGRLLSDETLVRSLETTAAEAQAAAADVRRIVAQLEPTIGGLNELTATINAQEGGVPELLRRADQALTSLQTATRNLSRAAERTPRIARNVENATENLPSLLTQTQQTARELEQTLGQLRRSWLLGGANAEAAEQPSDRLPATEVRP
jgi:phospholipid/cholesterol/gamma-HCH transport system substrate-binding protein